MVRPILVEGARMVVAQQGVTARAAPALLVDAKVGPWRQVGARAEVTSDQVCASWCVGFAMVEQGLQDGESYDWCWFAGVSHRPSGLLLWQ
jgi:hypothetical protein